MSKYNNRKVKIDNITFDSFAEGERYSQLKILLRAGQISDLEIHPIYTLQRSFSRDGKSERAINYEADFAYYQDGQKIVEDVKGMKTDVYKIKRKLFLAKYPQFKFVEVGV